MNVDLPLLGSTALITGVSRRRGIGYATATKLASLGANIVIQHHQPHDEQQPWGADDLNKVRAGVLDSLRGDAQFADFSLDFKDPRAPSAAIAEAAALTGTLDILICNHAMSGGDGSILDMTPQILDDFWEVDTRSTLLLTAEFARRFHPRSESAAEPGERLTEREVFKDPRGRVVWLTSGQMHGPMRGEVAYVTSKAALAGATPTVAAELLDLGIVLNTVNPGPVNTGYLDPETTDRDLSGILEVVAATPFGRVGRPADTAELVAWLVGPGGKWVVGQVITSDGGFSLA